MNKFLDFFANLIDGIFAGGNYILSIALLAMLAKLIFLFPSNNYYKSIKLSEHLLPKIDKIREKFKKHKDRVNEEISTLLMQSGYSMAGGISSFVIYAVLGVIISLVFKDAYVYLDKASDLTLQFIGIDVTKSAFNLFFGEEFNSFAIVALCLVVVSVALQSYHDTLMAKKLIIDQSLFNKIMLVATVIGSVFLPEAFLVFWIVLKCLDLIHYFYTLKFVNITEAQVESAIANGKRRMKK